MEADLQIHAGVDLRDFWRFNPDGSPRLSLRRIKVLIGAVPVGRSMVRRALGLSILEVTDYLLMDLINVWSGEPHPSDPRAEAAGDKPSQEVIDEGRKRSAQRRAELGITGSVLRPQLTE